MAGNLSQPDEGRLEQLVGLRSSKPTYYAEWRGKALALTHAVEALRAVTVAMDATTQGPQVVCERLVEAVVTHFEVRQAGVSFHPASRRTGRLGVTVLAGGARVEHPAPHLLAEPVRRAVAAAVATGRTACAPAVAPDDPAGVFVALPMHSHGELLGALFISWPRAITSTDADAHILRALAQHAAATVENACLYQENSARYEQLRQASQDLASARRERLLSDERQRIARELHDTVAQHLVGIGMNLEWCRRHRSDVPPAMLTRVERSQVMAGAALKQIRTAIFELSQPPSMGLTIDAALRDLADRMTIPNQLTCTVQVTGDTTTLHIDLASALHRVAQEALFNVLRHSGAAHAWVRLHVGAQVRLTVCDDGGGDPGVLRSFLTTSGRRGDDDHHGLANICSRAREVGGSVRVSGRRSGGIRLTVTVPLAARGTEVGPLEFYGQS